MDLQSYNELFFQRLVESKDSQLSGIAKKSIKEINYHLRHSSKWVLRLGDGTVESHTKAQVAINDLWMFTDELFQMNQHEIEIAKQKIGVYGPELKSKWYNTINKIVKQANLCLPKNEHMQSGGRSGIHTEYLGHMLSDMQYLQRSYPDAKW